MKITYKFVTGEVAEVEVSEEIGAVIVDLDRQEYNNDHKETRRHYSLEGKVYEGMDYGDRGSDGHLCRLAAEPPHRGEDIRQVR